MNELELLNRIATALEGIAEAMGARAVDASLRSPQYKGATPQQVDADAYTKAVEELKAMTDDIPAEPDPVEPPKKEEVIAALNSYARVHGVEAGKKLIASYGVKRLDEIPVEKWADVVGLCAVAK
jgi:hypothetical protein